MREKVCVYNTYTCQASKAFSQHCLETPQLFQHHVLILGAKLMSTEANGSLLSREGALTREKDTYKKPTLVSDKALQYNGVPQSLDLKYFLCFMISRQITFFF